jgi:hypothetical protein
VSDYVKAHPVQDRERREAWRAKQSRCHACGRWPHQADHRGFHVHHIAKFGRSDEECNLLLLCATCHDVIEGERVVRGNGHWPALSLAHQLWIKMERDPSNWDPERIRVLRGRATLPTPEMPPSAYSEGWR